MNRIGLFSSLLSQILRKDATQSITDEIRVYLLNTFEILEMIRKMMYQIRLDMNTLIRDEGILIRKSIYKLNVYTLITNDHTREEMRKVDQEYAIGVAIIVILVCVTCHMLHHLISSSLLSCARSASLR